MATLRKGLQVLPLDLLISMDTAKQVAGIWVRLKKRKDIFSKSDPSPPAPTLEIPCPYPLVAEGSILCVLDCERLTREQQVMYLDREEDLWRHAHSHSPLVQVLSDLLSLYIELEKPVLQARVRIQLARIAQHCTPLCQHRQLPCEGCGPPDALDDVCELLRGVVAVDSEPQGEVWQGLAEAYLWKVIINTSSLLPQQQTTELG